ncbi:hypothetical protein FHR99_001474 [Litorivivens lipolytica]|uniref:Uncharacterized protein n=1 Tax=Litorivivens lipolytica TaxID=1524264 RepID=A0A7W4Z5I3_9GAMM|nr:hypothetical protein [Litorivivens lipolytica]MBB3047238.1 hypothetical protein [Litorivivens lipolytica]
MKKTSLIVLASAVFGLHGNVMAEDMVPVLISGAIAAVDGGGTCSIEVGSTVEFNFDGDASEWRVEKDSEGAATGRFQYDKVPTSPLTIDCSETTAETQIEFATNNPAFRQEAGGANPFACGSDGRCTSYPVAFVPDPRSCAVSGDESCVTQNLQEGYITVNLASCTGNATCTTGVFAGASATADAGGELTATFSGTLFSTTMREGDTPPTAAPTVNSAPTGSVISSPRSPAPMLYVIYGGS